MKILEWREIAKNTEAYFYLERKFFLSTWFSWQSPTFKQVREMANASA